MRTNTRNSSFELLRIISMLFVLILHVNLATGIKMDYSIGSWIQAEIESLSIMAVNVFVLISGWFSIKSERKLQTFVAQSLFYSVLCLLGGVLLGLCESFKTEMIKLVCFDWNWFVITYLFLLLLAPVMNCYLETTDRHRVKTFLVLYFFFCFLLGFFTNGAPFLCGGYSVAFFIPLYVFARYCRLNNPRFCQCRPLQDILIVFACSCINTCLFKLGVPVDCYSYCNPIVIIQSLFCLLFFSKLTFHSDWINRIAIAAFPVFLLHTNSHFFEALYKSNCISIMSSQCSFIIVIYVISWFVIAFAIEQMRQSIITFIQKNRNNRNNNEKSITHHTLL